MEKCTLVIINGKSGSGKDLFCDFCAIVEPETYRVVSIHRSDPYKEILTTMGWKGERTEEIRTLLKELCDFGEDWGYNRDYLLTQIFSLNSKIDNRHKILFYHCREARAIEKLKADKKLNKLTNSIETLFIDRKETVSEEPDCWYFSDDIQGLYDVVIHNDSDKNALMEQAKQYLAIAKREE